MRVFKGTVKKFSEGPISLGDFLFKLTKLKPAELGDAATKGAVWIQRNGKGKILRIRVLNEMVSPEDIIQIYYDPKVLKLPTVSNITPIFESEFYGIWPKPSGVVPQGSQTGDHASLLRYVELHRKKEVFLVHRLDRETEGLMIIAYKPESASYFSYLFQENLVLKEYQAIVLGELERGSKQTIEASLDDKEAITHFEVLESKNNQSLLSVSIETGRLHQIRRHLDFIGHPVMGDPKYGRGNKNRTGMKLLAYKISFLEPGKKEAVTFTYPTPLSF